MSDRFATLQQWLQWQESLHPFAIEMGLDRVAKVYKAMRISKPADFVITVAGTNGKGSCISMLEQLYCAADYRVGSYTSPHLLRYNERIKIQSVPVSDVVLLEAFAAVDVARQDISLTYFEFATLAALWIFAHQQLDVVLLEVGMGGRLDATNIIDADAALISNIDLDHQAWLGDSRDAIASEKAGIFRTNQYAACGDRNPPASLLSAAKQHKLQWQQLAVDFDFSLSGQYWHWHSKHCEYNNLPLPEPATADQLNNIASVIALTESLQQCLPYTDEALQHAIRHFALPGRCQIIDEQPQIWIDVAHNPAAIKNLCSALKSSTAAETHLVFAVLDDKPFAEMATELQPEVSHWYLSAPATERALDVSILHTQLQEQGASSISVFSSVAAAYQQARQCADKADRIIVTGSFYTVAEVMAEREHKRL